MRAGRDVGDWFPSFDPDAAAGVGARKREMARAADRADARQRCKAALDLVVCGHALCVVAVSGGRQRDERRQQPILIEAGIGAKHRLKAAECQPGAHQEQ